MVSRLVSQGTGSPFTSSAGRLCDAIAAMCGVRLEVSYEGQAAIEFEALAEPGEAEPYPFRVDSTDPEWILDPRSMIIAVLADLAGGVPVPTISARFHAGFARATAELVAVIAQEAKLDTAVLSGGVFQNRLLLTLTAEHLEAAGMRVLVPELLPPNDGQIAYGQVAVAAARHGM